MLVSSLPQVALTLLADRPQQAVAHLVHHTIGATRVLLMLARAQIVRRQGCQPVGLSRDVRVTPAQARRQKPDALQAVVVRHRGCIAQQRFHFVA